MLKSTTFNKLLSAARECLNMLSRSEALLEPGGAAASLSVSTGQILAGGGGAAASLSVSTGQILARGGGAAASLSVSTGHNNRGRQCRGQYAPRP